MADECDKKRDQIYEDINSCNEENKGLDGEGWTESKFDHLAKCFFPWIHILLVSHSA